MFFKKCRECGKETLGKLCSVCKIKKQNDPYGFLLNETINDTAGRVTENEKKIRSETSQKQPSTTSDGCIKEVIERSETEAGEQQLNQANTETKPSKVKKKIITPYLLIIISLATAGYGLTQVNYKEAQQNLTSMLHATPTTVEETIEVNSKPPYEIQNKYKIVNPINLKLQIKCGNNYKPVLPLGTLTSEWGEPTLLLGLNDPDWSSNCDQNYKLTDGSREIKIIPVPANIENIELYAVNIPLQSVNITEKTKLVNKKNYIIIKNPELKLETMQILEATTNDIINGMRKKETFTVVDLDGKIVKIFHQGKDIMTTEICEKTVKC